MDEGRDSEVSGVSRFKFVRVSPDTYRLYLKLKRPLEGFDTWLRRILSEAGYQDPSLPVSLEEALRNLEEE